MNHIISTYTSNISSKFKSIPSSSSGSEKTWVAGRENAGEGAKAVTEDTKRVAKERMAAIFMFIGWYEYQGRDFFLL